MNVNRLINFPPQNQIIIYVSLTNTLIFISNHQKGSNIIIKGNYFEQKLPSSFLDCSVYHCTFLQIIALPYYKSQSPLALYNNLYCIRNKPVTCVAQQGASATGCVIPYVIPSVSHSLLVNVPNLMASFSLSYNFCLPAYRQNLYGK